MAVTDAGTREKEDDHDREESGTSTTEPVERIVFHQVERNSKDRHGVYISEQDQLMRHAAAGLKPGAVVVDMGTSFVGGMRFTDESRKKFLDGLDDSIGRLRAMSRTVIESSVTD